MARWAERVVEACWIIMSLVICSVNTAPAQEVGHVNALVLTGAHFRLDDGIRERLDEQGIRLVVRQLGDPVSFEMLRLFEVVVVPDFAGLSTPVFTPHNHVVRHLNSARNIGLLHEYVQAGGGVFFSPAMLGAGKSIAEGCDALLKPWGVRVLAAQVRDDAHACCEGEYAWTDNVPASAVCQGVRHIVYPTNMLRWDDAYATVPFAFDSPAWQAVVSGMPESVAARSLEYTTWFPVEGQKAPSFAAIREVERGRVAVLGVCPFYTFWMPFAKPKGGWIGESHTGSVDGIFLEKGNGKMPSDGLRLIVNMLRWLAEGSRAAGLGGYSEERLAALPQPAPAQLPAWLTGWRKQTGARPFKVLVGARSAYSDGQGTVSEFSNAARQAGYDILVMTETFEHIAPGAWDEFYADCLAASSEELVVLPGLDIPDVYQNRYILFGQRSFPEPFMLSDDGMAIKAVQNLALGFGTHFAAIHRPSSTPMVHQLYKFCPGMVVFTYRGGSLADDGLLAYEWHVNNLTQPLPIVVHEVRSPDEVEVAASSGHQLFVFADTVANAAWYLRAGEQHFWESPPLFLVSAGPLVRTLSWGEIEVESKSPIVDVQLRNHGYAERRWRPNARQVSLRYHFPASHLRLCYLYVEDEEGRTAISAPLRGGPTPRYTWRCSDRQNFFGWAWNYIGTRLPDVNVQVPAFGTDEGRGLWPHSGGPRRGENTAPLLEFPYASPEVYVTDAYLDQRYWRALWEEVAYDARAPQGTGRSRVYEGRVRYYDFNIPWQERTQGMVKDPRRPMMVKEITLRLRRPVIPQGPVFPVFTSVSSGPQYGYFEPRGGKWVSGRLQEGFVDLPVGGYAADLIALSPGIRVSASGSVGFAAPQWPSGSLPTGTSWFARYVRVPAEADMERMRVAYVAYLEADRFGVAGTVQAAAEMPYLLPLFIEGLNCNWHAAVWRGEGSLDDFGVFEGRGLAKLDVTKGGPFYAGNIIVAGNAEIRLSVLDWMPEHIVLEANNPTRSTVETVVETPAEIKGRYHLRLKVSVPAGRSVRFRFPGED